MKANKDCPSFDCGFCETFPAPYSVKCGGKETKNCIWLNFDFYGAKYNAQKTQKPKKQTSKKKKENKPQENIQELMSTIAAVCVDYRVNTEHPAIKRVYELLKILEKQVKEIQQ